MSNNEQLEKLFLFVFNVQDSQVAPRASEVFTVYVLADG